MALETIQSSYITMRKTYLLTCQACGECRECQASELPQGSAPYSYQCSCGQTSQIRLVSFRRAPRKAVELRGVLAVSTPNGTKHLVFRVEDLSVSGVRVRTEAVGELQPPIKIVLGLPGAVRSMVQASCALRRTDIKDSELQVALEFQALTPEQEQALEAFLSG